MLRGHLAQFQLAPEFTEAEVLHYLLPVEGVIDAYVVEGPGTLLLKEGQSFESLSALLLARELPCLFPLEFHASSLKRGLWAVHVSVQALLIGLHAAM